MAYSEEMRTAYWVLFACFIHVDLIAQTSEGLSLNAALVSEYDNNVLPGNNPVSAQYRNFSPQRTRVSSHGKQPFSDGYLGELAAYSEHSELSFDAHHLNGSGLFDPNHRFKSEFEFSYQNIIDEPGSSNSALTPAVDECTPYTNKSMLAGFCYGARQSIGQFVFPLDIQQASLADSAKPSDVITISESFLGKVEYE